MAICRIYTPQPLNVGAQIVLDAEQSHYLRQVMRSAVGDSVILFNGDGGEFEAEITSLSKQGAQCVLTAFHDVNRELPLDVHIIQCANRREKIETVLQKGTELGARSFQIANSERSQFVLKGNKAEDRLQRWHKIIVEAAEQSGRTEVPTLHWRASLQDCVVQGSGFALHPHQHDAWHDFSDAVIATQAIALAVGPEGGWSARDLEVLAALHCAPLCFGARIMRTETAAPALLAAVQAMLLK